MDISLRCQQKHRKAFIAMENKISCIEIRLQKFCENIKFEVIVESDDPSDRPIEHFFIGLTSYLKNDANGAIGNWSRSFTQRMNRIKEIQEEYKILKNAAMVKLTDLEEKYKHEKAKVILLEYKADEKFENWEEDDEEPASSSQDKSEISVEEKQLRRYEKMLQKRIDLVNNVLKLRKFEMK